MCKNYAEALSTDVAFKKVSSDVPQYASSGVCVGEENDVMQLLKELVLLDDHDRASASPPKEGIDQSEHELRQARRREITEQLRVFAEKNSTGR